eukprot:TRINITY_DN19476_c0_g1_i1.p1 TRINITY_DN19476_c0_g1~~TRINITY_DN19476_c0_g1_i1.p1  ORF type:complete len:356 (+),score=35.74 TRINITY_DN19476_c0_g1_i1:92-1159(+)
MRLQTKGMLIITLLSHFLRGLRFDEQESPPDKTESPPPPKANITSPEDLDKHCEWRGFCTPFRYCELSKRQRRCRVKTRFLPQEHVASAAAEAMQGLVDKTADAKRKRDLFFKKGLGILSDLKVLSGSIDAMLCKKSVYFDNGTLQAATDNKSQLVSVLESFRAASVVMWHNWESLWSGKTSLFKCVINVSAPWPQEGCEESNIKNSADIVDKVLPAIKPNGCPVEENKWAELREHARRRVESLKEAFGAEKSSCSSMSLWRRLKKLVIMHDIMKKSRASKHSSLIEESADIVFELPSMWVVLFFCLGVAGIVWGATTPMPGGAQVIPLFVGIVFIVMAIGTYREQLYPTPIRSS